MSNVASPTVSDAPRVRDRKEERLLRSIVKLLRDRDESLLVCIVQEQYSKEDLRQRSEADSH